MGLVFAAREPERRAGGVAGAGGRGSGRGRCARAAGLGAHRPLDARVRDQIVAETRGNPLALLELPRGVTPAELAGGFALPGAVPLSRSIEESFRRRLEALPAETRRLLLLAAADPVGEPLLVWRAAERLGIGTEAAAPAAEAGLLEFGARVRFRHPLVRSAAYRSASLQERQEVHRALAEVTDPELDPDRRAWHRAQAAPGPDEDVAAELERSAGRAQARGGLAAAAAFLERAAMLTPEPGSPRRSACSRPPGPSATPARSTRRSDCWSRSRPGPLDALRRAEVEHLRGQIAFDQQRGGDAARLLLSAARRLEPLDAGLWRARRTWRRSWPRCGPPTWTAPAAAGGRRGRARRAPRPRTAAGGRPPARRVRAAVDGGIRSGRADADASTRAVSRSGRRRRGRPLAAGAGSATSPWSCGTPSPGMPWPLARFSSPATRARSCSCSSRSTSSPGPTISPAS